MNTIDIIKIACDFTGNEEISVKLDERSSLTESEQKVVDALVKCLNLVQNEVATEYIPLEAIEEVKAVDLKVPYSAFSKKPIAVIFAKDSFGRNLRFRTFSDYLMVYAPRAKVKYHYMPDEITSVEGELAQPLLPMRIYAYGVAREYFLLQTLGDDADIWEVRFKDSLSIFARKKQEVRLPCRRWL